VSLLAPVVRAAAVLPLAGLLACAPLPTRDRPGCDVRTTFGGAASTAALEADFCEQRAVFVPVTVNGIPTTALLDTGADVSFLERGFAARAGVVGRRSVSVRGMVGTAAATVADGVAMDLGSLRLEGLSPAIVDLSDLATCAGREVPVILGEDVFERAVVEMDLDRRRVTFHDPVRFRAPGGAVVVPLERATRGRLVRVSVEGGAAVPARLDLGCATPLVLRPSSWDGHRLLDRRRSSTWLAAGAAGVFEERVATVASLRFSGVELVDVPTSFLPPDATRGDPTVAPAIVGLPAFEGFHLWVDYPRDALHLVRLAPRGSTAFRRDQLGLVFDGDRGALRVIHVAPGSPAAAAGLRRGDRVLAIDTRPAGSWTPAERRALGARPEGTTVALRMADGTTRVVRLARYY
jgi:hypothetical protein